ncbi:hypothetical protein CC80DRAFT_407837 [Byssothecium circinans]|uniref:Uncharacterized protein n=1 Tax=Byssothecium circinans TaxID=147558 RepID=A0A6A5UCU2_9PLEO|nr:hypothetical protein CC80DRAFT_407837 [Byssothecium circinans]
MSGSGSDYLADLSTDPIFDEALYCAEALLLPVTENEDGLDNHLAMAARESGIENPFSFLEPKTPEMLTSLSIMSLQSEQGSAASIRSQETQSTGFTSQPSRRTSRDNAVQPSPMVPSPPTPVRASYFVDPTDFAFDGHCSTIRHRHSASTFSTPNSVVSDSPSARQGGLRKRLKRNTGLFSLFRKDSGTSTSKPRQSDISNLQSLTLDCGHTLSKQAIRIHVQDALNSKEQITPACCGKPLPKEVLQTVLTREEADLVKNTVLPSPDAGSLRDSGYSEDGVSSMELPRLDTEIYSIVPLTVNQDLPQIDEDSFDSKLAKEAFKSLKEEQREQFHRVALFESNQRKALDAHHRWILQRLEAQYISTKSDRIREHPTELERLDEFQINAEHELRKAHATETQNVTTALKYMTAYCSGLNPTDPTLAHVVTDEDRKKLDHQRLVQQKLPAKQESAISVLRAKQDRATKNKLEKQKKELQHLNTDYENNKKAEVLQHVKETSRLEAMIQARRRRIMSRWELRFEMFRKDWENQYNTTLCGRLAHEDWPEITDDADSTIPFSSSLALYAQLAS